MDPFLELKKNLNDILGDFSIDFNIDVPENSEHGDLTTNIAMVSFKEIIKKSRSDRNASMILDKFSPSSLSANIKSVNKTPLDFANFIKEKLEEKHLSFLKKISVVSPGFINFYLSDNYFEDLVLKINSQEERYGSLFVKEKTKVVVEYSSPNIAKPFTVGHLRSTVIGDALANLFSFAGFDVIRDNHLGDWGTQFGKMIYALKAWGDIEGIKKSETPLVNLVNLYIKFHQESEKKPEIENDAREYFVKLEKGDEEERALWKMCIDLSLVEFNKIYKKLGIKFDTMLGESFFEDKMSIVLKEAKEKNIAKKSEGALIIEFSEQIKLPPMIIQKSDGGTIYATRDLATDRYRKEIYGEDILIINEVGNEQALYFRQLFEAEEMLGYFSKKQRVHVGHGLFRFEDGKMSTRKGNVIWLENILNEAIKKAEDFGSRENAEKIAIGAIKFNDLKREPKKDITFSWDEILNMQGDSGPYLLYTYARIISVFKKQDLVEGAGRWVYEENNIVRLLEKFTLIIKQSLDNYSCHYLAIYLVEISREFNSWYANNKIIDLENKELSKSRLALVSAVGYILKAGLNILGIETVENM